MTAVCYRKQQCREYTVETVLLSPGLSCILGALSADSSEVQRRRII